MTPVFHSTEQIIHANGINIAYESFGDEDDPVIILVMGLAAQMIFWDVVFCNALANCGYRVIRFDNRDVGKSTWLETSPCPSVLDFLMNALFGKKLTAPYSLEDMADDIIGLMDGLRIDNAHIVGASMGGMIAQVLSIRAPQRVKTLTSIMSTTGNKRLAKPKLSLIPYLLKPAPKKDSQFVNFGVSLWKRLHGSVYTFNEDYITDLLTISLSRGVNQAANLRQFASILSAEDRTASLKKLSVPSLIIHGEDDPLIPVSSGYATANAIDGAKLKVYSGMGHTLPEELLNDISNDIVEHVKAIT